MSVAAGVSVRLAGLADADCILEWRNDPVTMAMSVTSGKISREDHARWFSRVLDDPREALYVGLVDNARMGMCRFTCNAAGTIAEVSINLDPARRGQGMALPLLQRAIADFTATRPLELTATIKSSNKPSQKIFTRCGFQRIRSESDCFYYLRQRTDQQ